MAQPIVFPLHLRSLAADETWLGKPFEIQQLDVQNLVYIESLILLEKGTGVHPEVVERMLSYDNTKYANASLLHTLKLEVPLLVPPQIMAILSYSRLKELQHLGLLNCSAIDDQLAAVIAEHGKRLKTLQIPNSKITGVGLKKLVLACPSLAAIELNGCREISMDAVEWAREQGLSVLWKMGV